MNQNYDKLIAKLRELFELDKADLDFGIYRIIGQRQEQISEFLDTRLKAVVQEELANNAAGDRNQIQAELEKLEQTLREAGMEPNNSPKVQELKAKLATTSSSQQLENDIYHHLYSFFSRYYEEGDFISQRRVSRNEKYAIPYNGEEVKLHWANADQYYIKTAENFRNYRFKLNDGRAVEFRLRDADTARDNTKGDKRFFELAVDEEGQPDVTEIKGEQGTELHIGFHYQPQPKKQLDINGDEKTTSRDLLNTKAHQQLWDAIPEAWHSAIFEPAPTEKTPNRTLLAKQLNDYTAKNSFDYFIHKDLGGFLRRELDFYIKNEVLFLDDIETGPVSKVEDALSSIRAIRSVAVKVIAFLAQLEDFQKKLWLKKKFVVNCHYCFTLDKLEGEDALLEEVCNNPAQRAEWVKLFALDLEQFDNALQELSWHNLLALPEYRYLVGDTQFFSVDFRYGLLAKFDDLDEQTDGVLFHSENFQALNLMQAKYREKIQCVYVDPPYNTDATPIVYKNGYKTSSWASLIKSRQTLVYELMKNDCVQFTAIDHAELSTLSQIKDQSFGKANRVAIVSIQHNPKGRNQAEFFSENSEFMLVYAKDIGEAKFNQLAIDVEVLETFTEVDELGKFRWEPYVRARTSWSRTKKPKNWYPIYVDKTLSAFSLEPFENGHELFPRTSSGDFAWKNVASTFSQLNESGAFKAEMKDGEVTLYHKYREQQVFKNFWSQKKYQSEFNGTNLLKNMLGDSTFSYPKSLYAVADCLKIASKENAIVADYFGGSGTTAHATILVNQERGTSRKYLLTEMGDYFCTVTKPRIQKAIYSREWKHAVPLSHSGSSHLFKTLKLESYEDTQNNLQLQQGPGTADAFAEHPEVAEDYLLHYMLDIESADSLLNLSAFSRPFDYQLQIAGDTAGEMKPETVDLVETFNFLIGLNVQAVHRERFALVDGAAKQGSDGHVFVTLEGVLPNGSKALVIWRDLPGWDDEADSANIKTQHNTLLDAVLEKLRVNPREQEFDVIYVNGDNTLPNIRREEDHWKVMLIEEEFHRLMFEDTAAGVQ